MALATDLKRNPGQLIRSTDWQALLEAVDSLAGKLDSLAERVTTELAAVDGRVDVLRSDVDDLRTDFDTFKGAWEPALKQRALPTLTTTRSTYAVGELAEVVAQVNDLQGVAQAGVWVDFVTVWGHLRARAGFESRTTSGGRAISVRTNASGEARVQLREEESGELTAVEEVEVSNTVASTISFAGASQPFSRALVGASTPQEVFDGGGFAHISRAYDLTDGTSRGWLDGWWGKQPRVPKPPQAGSWTSYEATVMAFVKRDGDPLTPDASRGEASIVLTFREWRPHWFWFDYLPATGTLLPNITSLLQSRLDDGELARIFSAFETIVSTGSDGKGAAGAYRYMQAVKGATDLLDTGSRPAQLDPIIQTFKHGVAFQAQALRSGAAEGGTLLGALGGAIGGGSGQVAALQASLAATQAQAAAAAAKADAASSGVRGLQDEASERGATLADLRTRVDAVGTRVDTTLADGGRLRVLDNQLQAVRNQVGALSTVDLTEVRKSFVELGSLRSEVETIKTRLPR